MHKNNLDMIYPSQLNRVVVTNMFSVFLWDIWDILKTREDIIKKKKFPNRRTYLRDNSSNL